MFASDLFQDRIAIVTGAGRGIGKATALRLAELGADVAVNDLDREAACETMRAIEAKDQTAIAVQGDVSDPDVVADIVDRATSELGTVQLLVNNAGAIGGAALLDLPPEEWDRVMEVNARGTFLMGREVGNRLVSTDSSGSIVNIASIAGLFPETGAGSYSPSKAAIVSLTEQMAMEWAGEGVRVNSVCPGLIWTPGTDAVYSDAEIREQRRELVPVGRIGSPEDVTNAAVYLLAPDNDYTTGESVVVDGGAQCVNLVNLIAGVGRAEMQ